MLSVINVKFQMSTVAEVNNLHLGWQCTLLICAKCHPIGATCHPCGAKKTQNRNM